VANGKLGIGSIETPRWHKAYKKESWELLQNEVTLMEEEDRQVQAVSMCEQGKMDKVGWSEKAYINIWSMEPSILSFTLKAVHDVLPTPTYLVQW
jgi:hypothetical protein